MVDKPAIPETLPEVPPQAGNSVEEAKLEEIADTKIGDGAEVPRQFVVPCNSRLPSHCVFVGELVEGNTN